MTRRHGGTLGQSPELPAGTAADARYDSGMDDGPGPNDHGPADEAGQASPLTMSVIIATLGREKHLAAALESLRKSTLSPDEVLIVDGSEDSDARSVAQEADAAASYPVRHHHSRPGLPRQRNVGLSFATGDIVVFLDDDAVVPPCALGEILAAYDAPEVIGATARIIEPYGNAIGGKVSPLRRLFNAGGPDGTFTLSGYPRRLQDESVRRDIEFMQGAFMSARLPVARSLGFDEVLTGYALAEDEDFSYRLSRRGRIRYLGDVEVTHDNAGFSTRNTVAFAQRVVRNRRYLFHKNFEQSAKSRMHFCLLLGVFVVHRLINREVSAAAAVAVSALKREEAGVGLL